MLTSNPDENRKARPESQDGSSNVGDQRELAELHERRRSLNLESTPLPKRPTAAPIQLGGRAAPGRPAAPARPAGAIPTGAVPTGARPAAPARAAAPTPSGSQSVPTFTRSAASPGTPLTRAVTGAGAAPTPSARPATPARTAAPPPSGARPAPTPTRTAPTAAATPATPAATRPGAPARPTAPPPSGARPAPTPTRSAPPPRSVMSMEDPEEYDSDEEVPAVRSGLSLRSGLGGAKGGNLKPRLGGEEEEESEPTFRIGLARKGGPSGPKLGGAKGPKEGGKLPMGSKPSLDKGESTKPTLSQRRTTYKPDPEARRKLEEARQRDRAAQEAKVQAQAQAAKESRVSSRITVIDTSSQSGPLTLGAEAPARSARPTQRLGQPYQTGSAPSAPPAPTPAPQAAAPAPQAAPALKEEAPQAKIKVPASPAPAPAEAAPQAKTGSRRVQPQVVVQEKDPEELAREQQYQALLAQRVEEYNHIQAYYAHYMALYEQEQNEIENRIKDEQTSDMERAHLFERQAELYQKQRNLFQIQTQLYEFVSKKNYDPSQPLPFTSLDGQEAPSDDAITPEEHWSAILGSDITAEKQTSPEGFYQIGQQHETALERRLRRIEELKRWKKEWKKYYKTDPFWKKQRYWMAVVYILLFALLLIILNFFDVLKWFASGYEAPMVPMVANGLRTNLGRDYIPVYVNDTVPIDSRLVSGASPYNVLAMRGGGTLRLDKYSNLLIETLRTNDDETFFSAFYLSQGRACAFSAKESRVAIITPQVRVLPDKGLETLYSVAVKRDARGAPFSLVNVYRGSCRIGYTTGPLDFVQLDAGQGLKSFIGNLGTPQPLGVADRWIKWNYMWDNRQDYIDPERFLKPRKTVAPPPPPPVQGLGPDKAFSEKKASAPDDEEAEDEESAAKAKKAKKAPQAKKSKTKGKKKKD